MLDNEIMIIYGDNPYDMTKKLLIKSEMASRIPRDAKIGIKPNVLMQSLPENGATTHPEIVEAIIDYLQERGYKNLLILEGAWIGDNTDRAFKLLGYDKISERTGVPLLNTKHDRFEKLTYGGITMEISKTALELDFLINVPVLKGHCQTLVTGAMKNLKGIISDSEKRHFHALGLHEPIAYLNKIICSDFVVMDGICGDLDFEEGGNPVQMNRILCCPDSVLIDSYEANTLGYEPDDVGYISIAAELSVGSKDTDSAIITELNKDLTLAKTHSSRKVKSLIKYIDEREACSACYANLIRALYRTTEKGKLPADLKVCIGQGFKGIESDGIGVGNCTNCMKKHVPGCPPNTIDIIKTLFN